MHASPRDRTWLYHIMCGYTYIYTLKATLALHHMWHRVRVIGGSCTNCGVIRESGGLCARCLDLPYCKKCKRHLSHSSFNEEQHHIFQVPLHVAIACIIHLCIPVPRLYKSDYYLTNRYRYTFSRLCLLTELRKAAHHTTYSTKQRRVWNFVTCDPIRHILRNTCQHTSTRHRGHRSRRLTAARVY